MLETLEDMYCLKFKVDAAEINENKKYHIVGQFQNQIEKS